MPVTSISSDASNLTLTAIGDYPVDVDRLWEAWTDPRQLERFWGPPQWPATFTELEVKEGGKARYYMTGPNGEESHGYWEFERVEPVKRFAVRDGFCGPDGTPNTQFPAVRMQVSFEETVTGSRFVVVSTFANVEAMKQLLAMGVQEGFAAALAQLDAVLAPSQRPAP